MISDDSEELFECNASLDSNDEPVDNMSHDDASLNSNAEEIGTIDSTETNTEANTKASTEASTKANTKANAKANTKASTPDKKKAKKEPRPKQTDKLLDLEKIKKTVTPPTIDEFIASPIIKCFKWLLENSRKSEIKAKKIPNSQEKINVNEYTSDVFKSKKSIKAFYEKFVKVYKVKKAFRDNLTETRSVSFSSKTLKLKSGKTVILEASEEDNKAINDFNKIVNDIYYNIDFSKLTGKNDDINLAIEYLKLDVNNTSNAYDLTEQYKNILDFEPFNFIYENIEYTKSKPTEEEVVAKYHELFNKNVYTSPFEVFTRREAILTYNDIITSKYIEKEIDKTVSSMSKTENKISVLFRDVILKNETYKNIFFNCYSPNKNMIKILKKLLDSKLFLESLDKDLENINFLFSSYMFWSKNFNAAISHTKVTKTKLHNRRNLMYTIMCSSDEAVLKAKNYWTGFCSKDYSDDSEQNYWLKNTYDEEKPKTNKNKK